MDWTGDGIMIKPNATIAVTFSLVVLGMGKLSLTGYWYGAAPMYAILRVSGIGLQAATVVTGTEVIERVTDNGIGIDRESLPCVFEMFVQSKAALGRGQPEDRRRTRDAGFDRHLIKPAPIPTRSWACWRNSGTPSHP